MCTPQPGIEARAFPPALLSLDRRFYIAIRTPLAPSAFSALLCWEGTPQSPLVLLCQDWVLLYLDCCSLISFRTPGLPTFQGSSASLDAFNPHRRSTAYIRHCSFSFRTPPTPSVHPSFPHSTSHLALLFSLVASPHFHLNISYCLSNPN